MQLEDSIIEQLPQIPYVIDQVDDALKWAKEALNESDYNRMLKVTYDVAEFTKSISEPAFFKTHYIIASIIGDIENVKKDERFGRFDTASKSVEKTIDLLRIDPKAIEDKGCFTAIAMHLIPLAKKDIDVFTISLFSIKHILKEIIEGMKKANVKTPITRSDYITVLGYALVMANIRMTDIKMSNSAYKVYNDIAIMLNEDLKY